jgi:hypothetical protein
MAVEKARTVLRTGLNKDTSPLGSIPPVYLGFLISNH